MASSATAFAAPLSSTALDAIDPFDVFVLDALLADCHSESQEHDPFVAQAALAAFLTDVDTFDHDLRAASDCHGGIDLTTTTAAAAVAQAALPARAHASNNSSVRDDGDSSAGLASTDSGSACLEDTSHDALVKSAFSLFAQNRALAFALEPARPLKRKRRIRPKEEIDTLRDTAASLERDLETLRASAVATSHSVAVQSTATSVSASSDSNSSSSSVAVEATVLEKNRELRQTVDAHLAFSRTLIDQLRTQQCDQSEIAHWLAAEKLNKQLAVTPADYAVFREAITGKLDAIYARIDEIFAPTSRSLAHTRVTSYDAHVAFDSDKRVTLHFRDEKTVPFGFQSVAEACWRCAKQDSIRASDNRGIAEILQTGDDVLLIKKALPLPLENNESVAVPVRAVFKRFLSKNRMVFCWEGTAEWPCELVERSDSKTTSVPMREKGWGLIRPMASGLCHIQICVHLVPGVSDERMLDVPARVQELSEIVMPTYQQMIASRFQMVENILLDAHR